MIRIQNIYYMLAYAFQILREQGYKSLAAEVFENTADLFSAILIKGVSGQIKRGLQKSYKEETEALGCLRGKINLSESIKQQTVQMQQLVCTYDKFSIDSYPNRILKTTMEYLMRADTSKIRKKNLKKTLQYFEEVKVLSPGTINWQMRYDRNNQTYRMLMAICYLVLKGLLQKTQDGKIKVMDFLDEQRMCRLYEKFILEYYRKEYPQLRANPSHIDWALDDGSDYMLPVMKTDITLHYQEKTMIIDAKYYAHTTQTQYNAQTLHSNNLYQIFTYVKNEAKRSRCVSGLLLYAKTDEEIQPAASYMMSGNRIGVGTLDLSGEFSQISDQLNIIAHGFMS